jgi:hypothetical protein
MLGIAQQAEHGDDYRGEDDRADDGKAETPGSWPGSGRTSAAVSLDKQSAGTDRSGDDSGQNKRSEHCVLSVSSTRLGSAGCLGIGGA